MKIGLVQPPSPAPLKRQAQAASSASCGIDEAAGPRAAPFADLGMFGRKAAPPPGVSDIRAPGTDLRYSGTQSSSEIAPVPVPSTGATAEPAMGSAAPDSIRIQPELAGPDELAAPKRGTDPLRSTETPSPPAAEAPIAEIHGEDAVSTEPMARSARSRPRPSSPGSPVSLTLREENGAVAIVAGTTPIDRDSRILLRRLVEAMLARSGLSLARFELNGAPVEQFASLQKGASNGNPTN